VAFPWPAVEVLQIVVVPVADGVTVLVVLIIGSEVAVAGFVGEMLVEAYVDEAKILDVTCEEEDDDGEEERELGSTCPQLACSFSVHRCCAAASLGLAIIQFA